jgi:hypothetical protein
VEPASFSLPSFVPRDRRGMDPWILPKPQVPLTPEI